MDRPDPELLPALPTVDLTAPEQAQMVQAALSQWPAPGESPVRHIETHISHLLLFGGHAYKIKKALATSFLDQSTLERRRHAGEEELRLNRRLAPDLYLGLVEITGSPQQPRLGGSGPVLDVAVKMRAFDQDLLWDRLAARGALLPDDIDDLAQQLARFHRVCAVAAADAAHGTPAQARGALLDSLGELRALAQSTGFPAPGSPALNALASLAAWEPAAFAGAAPAMAARLAAGRVRECHGDLHLGNVAREGRQALVFDGIDFNDAFRWIDVIDELAFMVMDLHAHGLPVLAHRLIDRYLTHSGDYDGLRVLGYYLVHRALVRAKVASLRALQADGEARSAARASAQGYLLTAAALARPARPALLITHGLSGSGKTSLTQTLVETGGVVRVRADVERKRLAGLGPLQSSRSSLGDGLYTPAMNDATQDRLLECATSALLGRHTVLLDATFIRRSARDEARACAQRQQVPFVVLRFAADPAVLQERITRRLAVGDDASEADVAVLQAQMAAFEPLAPDELAEVFEVTESATDGTAAPDWTALLERLSLPVC